MTIPVIPKPDSELWDQLTDLASGYVKSFTLKAVLELHIADIIFKAGGQLTLDEIVAKLPSKTVKLDYLARLMTYASLHKLFKEVSDSNVAEDGHRRFGLTPLSSSLLTEDCLGDYPNMVSIAPFIELYTTKAFIDPFTTFSEAVLSGTAPVILAHGVDDWELSRRDPEWAKAFQKGMASSSIYSMNLLVKMYKGFHGVKHLVDVGGGFGASVTVITQAYPHLQCTNFDLPEVVTRAPEIPHVKHVGGNMFESVPEGDAIFMKWILHDWTDEECIRVLKNCHKALPEHGKVILAEFVLSDPKDPNAHVVNYGLDIIMLAHTSGRERTAHHWHRLVKAAGFERVEIHPTLPLSVIEGYKS